MKFSLIFFLLATTIATNAQDVLYNNGSILQVNTGCIVQVNGNLTNTVGSTFTNDGTVTVIGNTTNNQVMAAANAGTLEFKGATAQSLNGSTTFFAKNVLVNNAAGVTMNVPLKVDGVFNFTNGMVTAATTANAVTFTVNGTVSNTNAPSNASHINGYVVKQGTGAFTYPVGDATTYQPVGANLTANGSGMQAQYIAGNAGAGAFTTTGSEATALVAYNKLEYWDITPLTTATGTVTINWDSYKNIGITNTSDLKVAHLSGGNWLNEGGTGIGNITNGNITSNSVSIWSPFTLGSINASSILPLTLLDFIGEKKLNDNQLKWQTAAEINTGKFEIEISLNNIQWTVVGIVAALGTGNNSYTFDNNNPPNGKVFYRLKIVDRDGLFMYSKIVTINGNGSLVNKMVNIYPNPANNNFNLDISDVYFKSNALLYSIEGRFVKNIELLKNHQEVDISTLASGIYILRFIDGNVERIIKK